MKITKVKVNLSAVIPTGSYQNYKPMYELEAELGDTPPHQAMEELREMIRRMFTQDWTRLRNKDKTDFLSKVRFYEKDGKKLPSVTSILSWADLLYKLRNPEENKFGGVEEDELAEYAARGTLVHKSVERWFHDTKAGKETPKGYKMVTEFADQVVEHALLSDSKLKVEDCDWLGFWEKHGTDIELKQAEKVVYGKDYAGRLDYYGLWKGEPAIFDVKTSSTYTEKVKLKYAKQMSAYAKGISGVKKPTKLVIMPLNPSNKCGFGAPIVFDYSENLFSSFAQDVKMFYRDFKDLF